MDNLKTLTLTGGAILAVSTGDNGRWRVSLHIPSDSDNALRQDWARVGAMLLGATLAPDWGEQHGNGYSTRTVEGNGAPTLGEVVTEISEAVKGYSDIVTLRLALLDTVEECITDTS